MTNEETPLLQNQHDLVYERFSPRRKKALVAMVSWSSVIAFFCSGTFIPSIPQVARDLNSSGEVINATMGVYIIANSLGGLISARYSKFYGRRSAYLWCFPLMILGSFGVAQAQSVKQLVIWRFFQAVGASPGIAIGAAVISDIYKVEERGTALGTYIGSILLGFALAPTIGGVTAHYWSWRGIHYLLGVLALGAFFCILFFFPETSHPGTMGVEEYKEAGRPLPKWRPVILNPLSQLLLLRSPNILAVAFIVYFAMLTDFALMIPFPYTIGKRYGIENEAIIGLCFIPLGVGNTIAAPLSGWISDNIMIKYKKKRGSWYPEDRLRASLFGSFIPITVLASGLITTYIPGRLGLILNLICLFINGLGCDIAVTPCSAYVVDVLHSQSAEVSAAVNTFRSVALAISTAAFLPMINTYGLLFTDAVVALVSLAGVVLTVITIAYGGSMRAWVDIGYSTEDNN